MVEHMAIKVQLKKQWNQFTLDVELQSQSRRIGILGASGCGKSMTLKSIAGVEHIDSGYVAIDGKVLYDSSKKYNAKPQKRKIGYLFQNYALFPTMTVEENIMSGLHGKKRDNQARTRDMVEKFQLSGLEKRIPGQLSGGQQQRVALARIMAYEPDMILLDEPFSALDMFLSDRLQQEMLEMLEDYDGTVILVSHNRDEIYRFSQELLIMEEGRILCQGPTKAVFSNPEKCAAARLTGCKNIADIKPVDESCFQIPDWDCTVYTQSPKAVTAKAVGYRAHEFRPVWGSEKKNCIPFRLKSMAELPFERKYFIYGKNETEICWFVQKDNWQEIEEKGLPDFLQIREDEILYLKE